MTEANDKRPEPASPSAERLWMFELDATSIKAVAGGLNPQPLPPGDALRLA